MKREDLYNLKKGDKVLVECIVETGINFYDLLDNPCADCPNHPSNGGSGVCQCILGTPKIT